MAMTDRGVTRPAMKQPERGKEMKEPMSPEHRREMLRMHHEKTLWVYWTVVLLGVWMMAAPLSFDYATAVTSPAGGRELWLDLAGRANALALSDFAAGFLLLLFGWRSLTPDRPVSLWGACFVGTWLNFAPLLFWAPNPLVYLNDTLVGTLVIALTILIPGMPNMVKYMQMGSSTPPGWSYNPSSWPQRWIMIALGLVGWLVSRYLAAFQLGYLPEVADPFFGEGSRRVLTSDMSRALPVSDAGLGALAYTLEFLMGWMGSEARWRTMPWMVTLFGILVIPLGLVHIFLVASQPVAVGEWCTYCLLAAAIMLPMIPLEVDEVIAMCQFMAAKKRQGASLWKVFWLGGGMEGEEEGQRRPPVHEFPSRKKEMAAAMFWGMTFPWTLAAATAVGVWLMAAPGVLAQVKASADLSHIAGALVVTVSVIAMGEPLRALRYLNLAVAAALVAGSFLAGSGPLTAGANIVSALLLTAFSLPRGEVRESFGSWDRFVR
uniref:Vitamin K epoxide reductase n=1 Tax=Geobacter sp. (strain M21) TaxID=443144 RepID=C6E1C6_GEOSM